MKIVTAKEFLSMKPSVLFQKYKYMCDWGNLCLKYENASMGINDFYYVNLMGDNILINGQEPQDTEEEMKMLKELEQTHGTFEREYECGQRDGLFDMEQLYVVYDNNDIRQLVNVLLSALPH